MSFKTSEQTSHETGDSALPPPQPNLSLQVQNAAATSGLAAAFLFLVTIA